jgi:hypothetical protein
MPADESDYFRVIICENKDFDPSQGSFLEIIIEVPQKPKPRRRSDTQIPLIRLAVRLMVERGTSSWSEKHVDVQPVKLSEIPSLGEPAAKEGKLTAWILRRP